MSNAARVPELDGIRGLAIVLVLIGHLFNALMPEAAGVGVSLFFVLSGYLITSILVREHAASGRIHLGNFYLRRARRLLPALLIYLVVFALAAWFAGWPGERIAHSTLPVFFYSGNWSGVLGWGVGQHMAHTWSLAVEEQFYIGWPLVLPLVLLAAARAWVMALLLALAVIASRYFVVNVLSIPADPVYTLLRYDEILLGCVLALGGWRFPWWVGVLAFIAMLAVSSQSGMRVGWNYTGYLLISLLCFFAVGAVQAMRKALSWTPLRHMGRISYSAYLWHYPIWLITANPWITLALTMAVAEMSWWLIEKPILSGRLLPWLTPRADRSRASGLAIREVRE